MTGSMRLMLEREEEALRLKHQQEVESRQIELERKRPAMESQIAMLREEFAIQEAALLRIMDQEKAEKEELAQRRVAMEPRRKSNEKPNRPKGGSK